MKRIMSKVFGAFIAGSMVLSSLPTVVSAAEAEAKPIDYGTTYANGALIDFGDGAFIRGYGEDEYQRVSGKLYIVAGDFVEYEETLESDFEGYLLVKFYSLEDVNVNNIYIYDIDSDLIENGLVFATWELGTWDEEGSYTFDIEALANAGDSGSDDVVDDVDDNVDDDETDPVKEVSDMIAALPEAKDVTIDDASAITDAMYAYDCLSEDEQAQVDKALAQKLHDVSVALARVWYDIFSGYGYQLLEDYGNVMGDETKAALEKALADGKVIADNEESTYDKICEAIDLVYDAVWAADDELSNLYELTEGADSSWTKGSKDKLVFRFVQYGLEDDAYESFLAAGSKIYIDDVEISTDNFTAEKGSVIISIIPELLETLSVGEHTLTIKFENSVSFSTKFTVKAASEVPATGETVSYVAIAGASLILLAGAAFVLSKRMVREEK